ncbi:MAG: hypothetical protein WCA21_09630 [Terracidiphilus sp.]
MTICTWRNKAAFASIVIFIVDVIVYVCRCLVHRGFYEGHCSLMVICAESGFIASVIVFPLALFGIRRTWKLPVAVGALVVAYLWFSDIAWWVMVK